MQFHIRVIQKWCVSGLLKNLPQKIAVHFGVDGLVEKHLSIGKKRERNQIIIFFGSSSSGSGGIY